MRVRIYGLFWVCLLMLGACATSPQAQRRPISRAIDPIDVRDVGSFERLRDDEQIAFSMELPSRRTTFYFEAANRSDRPVVRVGAWVTTILSLQTTTSRQRILAAAISGREETSRDVQVTVFEGGTASITVAPGGRVAVAAQDLDHENRATFTYLPFATGSANVLVSALTSFVGPDGKRYPAGSYEFARGTLSPVSPR